jgi:O-antigen biosynthesis protein
MRQHPSDPVVVEQTDAGCSSSVSVVISTRNRPALLRRCLEGISTQVPPPLEMVVIDNSPGDQATRVVALQAEALYIAEPITGVSRARNRGLQSARGDIVALIDDDAVPEPGWLAALAAEFRDDRVAAVSGRILSLSVTDDHRDVLFGGPELVAIDRASPDWFGRTGFGGIGQGSNLAVRRALLDTWKGFDERLGAGTRVGGMEEHHAFFSLVDAGHRVVYTPAATVLHPPPASAAELAHRYVSDLTAAGFFVALLIAEQPHHRRRAARYALEALRGTPRRWRAQMVTAGSTVPRIRRATAPLLGAALYVLTRLRMQAPISS